MVLKQMWVREDDRDFIKKLARMKGYDSVPDFFQELVKLLKDEKLNVSQKVNLDWGN